EPEDRPRAHTDGAIDRQPAAVGDDALAARDRRRFIRVPGANRIQRRRPGRHVDPMGIHKDADGTRCVAHGLVPMMKRLSLGAATGWGSRARYSTNASRSTRSRFSARFTPA